jgi:hypothetical protein
LRGWLSGGIGEGDKFLRGNEDLTWSLPSDRPLREQLREQQALDKDLLTVHNGIEEQDMFSRFLSSSLLDLWSWLASCKPSGKGPEKTTDQSNTPFRKAIDPDSGILHYSEQRLLKINNILISVLGAAMPIVAIVALYFVKTEGGRLGAMAGFTVVFALLLAIFTNARRLEIAAATAA